MKNYYFYSHYNYQILRVILLAVSFLIIGNSFVVVFLKKLTALLFIVVNVTEIIHNA